MNKEEMYKDNPRMLEIHNSSGEYCNSDPIVALLYRLMRDEVTPGKMEGIVQDILEKHGSGTSAGDICYTNGWLAMYAANIIERLNEENVQD